MGRRWSRVRAARTATREITYPGADAVLVHVRYEATTTTDVMQVTVPEPFCDGAKQFLADDRRGPGSHHTPLVAALLEIPHVVELFFVARTVSVQKAPSGAWPDIVPRIQEALERHEPVA